MSRRHEPTSCIGRLAIARLVAVIVAAFAAGCADVSSMMPSQPPATPLEQARDVEPMLETAGFQALPATTPDQMKRIKALPALKLGSYLDGHGDTNYWMADSEYCGCLFHGDEVAYQRYQQLKKDNQVAQQDRGAMMAQRFRQPPTFGGPFGGYGPGPPGFGLGFGQGGFGGFQFSL